MNNEARDGYYQFPGFNQVSLQKESSPALYRTLTEDTVVVHLTAEVNCGELKASIACSPSRSMSAT